MKRPSNLLSPMLVLLGAFFPPAVVMGADDPQATTPLPEKSASASTAPVIVHNPDGTFTVQKASPKTAKDPNTKKGLVIVPQVVVPIVSVPQKRD